MITVVGSINLDLVARVERLPTPGETVSGVEYTEVAGGKGANQALAVRRAGASTMMVGAIGHDANAEAATALLKAASVDLTLVEAVDAPTGVALILVDAKTGENQIAVVPGANDHVSIGRLPDETKGLLLQMEIPHAVNEAFLADAEAQGIPVFFNPAPFCANAVDLALKATVIIVNETEFDLLADAMAISPPNHAEDIGEERTRIARGRSFVQKTGKTIIITLGAAGALLLAADEEAHAVPPSIAAVDTVGAGDTFCGYFAAAYADGKSLTECLDIAVVAGALACLKEGAQPAIPTMDKVLLARGKTA